jgi:hypothetical protein
VRGPRERALGATGRGCTTCRPSPTAGRRPPGTPLADALGELVAIPGAGTVADMVVDPGSQRVFLSNRGDRRIEVLELQRLAFATTPVLVGSEFWCMAMNRTGDTLLVANSGGTNISFSTRPRCVRTWRSASRGRA